MYSPLLAAALFAQYCQQFGDSPAHCDNYYPSLAVRVLDLVGSNDESRLNYLLCEVLRAEVAPLAKADARFNLLLEQLPTGPYADGGAWAKPGAVVAYATPKLQASAPAVTEENADPALVAFGHGRAERMAAATEARLLELLDTLLSGVSPQSTRGTILGSELKRFAEACRQLLPTPPAAN